MKESNHAKTKVKGKLNDMAEISFEKKKLENRIAKYKQQIIDEDGEFQELLYHTEKDSLKSRYTRFLNLNFYEKYKQNIYSF